MTIIDLILYLILFVSLISTTFGARMVPLIKEQARELYGEGALVLIFALTWILRGLWIWLAFETGLWQFAGLAVIGFLIGAGVNASTREVKR